MASANRKRDSPSAYRLQGGVWQGEMIGIDRAAEKTAPFRSDIAAVVVVYAGFTLHFVSLPLRPRWRHSLCRVYSDYRSRRKTFYVER